MTYAELKQGTALLGFTDSLDELSDTAEASFRAALGRAMVQADALRPRTGTLFLTHAPARNLTDCPHFTLVSDMPHEVKVPDAVAYWFEGRGRGTCNILAGDGSERKIEWDAPDLPAPFWGIVGGGVTLTFRGEGAVENLGVYDGADGVPIPHGGGAFVRYSLSARALDFRALAEAPAIWQGERYITLTDGYDTDSEGNLYLARNLPGSYRVRYFRTVPVIGEDFGEDDEIPLERDQVELLPLLIAYYLLLDEEPDKATEYLNLFREGALLVRREAVAGRAASYRSVNGW